MLLPNLSRRCSSDDLGKVAFKPPKAVSSKEVLAPKEQGDSTIVIKNLSHYNVIERFGQGGMGEVYRDD